jgi:hypothetical protein
MAMKSAHNSPILVTGAAGDIGAIGRTIRYRNVPLSGWTNTLSEAGVPMHLVKHLAAMADLHAQRQYDRMTDDLFKLTGKTPTSMHDFVKLYAAEFTRREAAA